MTGQTKDTTPSRDDRDDGTDPKSRKPANGVGPSTQELLRLLNSIDGKASA